MTVNKIKFQDFADEIFQKKYALHGEKNREEVFALVAERIASVESGKENQLKFKEELKEIMNRGESIPGGRITANARPLNIQKTGNYINCFTIDMEDDMEKIYESIKEHALISKSGGGVGIDVSKLRPNGAKLKAGGTASGPLSFLNVVNESSKTIVTGGGRRSANIALLDISHPDIEEFITYKRGDENKRLQMFNISVKISDRFIAAVDANEDWDLVFDGKIYKTVKARDLWNRLTKNAFMHNEPGIFNSDTIEKMNNGWWKIKLSVTNPCTVYDTKVAVADGRGYVQMGDLAKEGKDIPVYCMDDNGDTVIRMMRNPRVTGYDKRILKVKLDDGSAIRRTENHQVRMRTGEYKRLDELVVGDSIHIGVKGNYTWEDVFENSNSKSQEYKMILGKNDKKKFEHRMIWEFYHKEKIPKGSVIHHIDLNPQNNRIENLQLMTKKDHDLLHGALIRGKANPYHGMSDEWKKNFATHNGESNGRYSGHTNEELLKIMTKWVTDNKKFLSTTMWEKIAKENGYPQYFTDFRGKISNLIKKANELGGLPTTLNSPYARRTYNHYLELLETTDLDISFENENIIVTKQCEDCGCDIHLPYQKREIGFCETCSAKRLKLKQVENSKKAAATKLEKRKIKYKQVIDIFKKFVVEKVTIPSSSFMLKHMNLLNINDFRTIGFSGYKEFLKDIEIKFNVTFTKDGKLNTNALKLIDNGLVYNHKVVSIEEDGYETVYNGTVDDFHNFNVVINDRGKSPITKRERWDLSNELQCGEIVMPPYSNCDLGALNLGQYVYQRFTDGAYFDFDRFKINIHRMIRLLDNVLDLTEYPIPKIKDMSIAWRRLGLGVTGLGNMFSFMRMKYGPKESQKMTHEVFKFLRDESYRASIQLAIERGPFPEFKKDFYLAGHFIETLPEDIREDIAKYGIRNVQINTIAPTGTISNAFGNNCSSGIEPTFSTEYMRTVLNMYTNEKETHPVLDHAWLEYKKYLDLPADAKIKKPEWFSVVAEVSPEDSIEIQSIAQQYIDHSISKTLNLAPGTTYEDYKDLFMLAYKKGLKGFTTFNPDGSLKGILNVTSDKDTNEIEILSRHNVKKRPEYLRCKIHTFHHGLKNAKEKIVVLLGFDGNLIFESFVLKDPKDIFIKGFEKDEIGVIRRRKDENGKNKYDICVGKETMPYEDFKMVVSNIGSFRPAGNSIGRMVSALLRFQVPLQFIVQQLSKDAVINDFEAALSRTLKIYIQDGEIVDGDKCPVCGGKLIYQDGCKHCKDCNWDKCGG